MKYKTQFSSKGKIFDKKKLIEYHCYKCQKFMFTYGQPPNALDVIHQECADTRCKAINNVLLFEGKCYPINNKLHKYQKMLQRFKSKITELQLLNEEYSAILSLVK